MNYLWNFLFNIFGPRLTQITETKESKTTDKGGDHCTQIETQSTNRPKKPSEAITTSPLPHPQKGEECSTRTSTASESCQKRQRIQNHIVPLKNSAWITWDLVSWGNCRYRGSMCTPPPALWDKRKRLSTLLHLPSIKASKTLTYIQKPNISPP